VVIASVDAVSPIIGTRVPPGGVINHWYVMSIL